MRSVFCARSAVVLVAVVLGTGGAGPPARAQPMEGLSYLPGATYSQAIAVSADGATVVGESGGEAFVWTAATGMVGVGHLPGLPWSEANGVSADGATVVGTSIYFDEQIFEQYAEAFVWTAATGMIGLGHHLGAQNPESYAYEVSADGSTVVGMSTNAQGSSEALLWTAANGMVGLGYLPGATSSVARGVSADGSTVVGYSDGQAFIWTVATGMVGIGTLPGFTSSSAEGVSGDGLTVVGSVSNQGIQEPFVWTAGTGMVGLGYLPGATYSAAVGVSGDGSTVVGASGGQAFVWTEATGMVGLGYLPADSYSSASAVSADGATVVGVSSNGQSRSEAFLLHLQPAPADLIIALIEQVLGLNLKHGIQNSLDSKLDAALHALEDVNVNNDVAAVNALNAFKNAVKAQRGKAIPAAAADALIAAATEIIDLLQ